MNELLKYSKFHRNSFTYFYIIYEINILCEEDKQSFLWSLRRWTFELDKVVFSLFACINTSML